MSVKLHRLSTLARSAGVVNLSPKAVVFDVFERQACPRRRASPATNDGRGGQAVSGGNSFVGL